MLAHIKQRIALAVVLSVAAVAGAVLLADGGEDGEPIQYHGVAPGPDFFGVNAPLLRAYAAPERATALEAISQSMAESGVRWARVAFDQAVEQRLPGSIDWSIPDQVVGALARHGIRTDALFIGTAQWSVDPNVASDCGALSRPGDVPAWSRFVGAAVGRFGRGGKFWAEHPEIDNLPIETWEIGNEENLRFFWCPAADPEGYAAVYRAARSAALASDPRASVIVGGLAPTFSESTPAGDVAVPSFLERMVDAQPSLAREIPAVAIHPYGPTPDLVLQAVRHYREAMKRAGLGRTPMIVNEVGWYTSGIPGSRFASQGDRADRIREITSASWQTNCNVIAFGLHAWVTAQSDPANPEDWYGLADPGTGEPNESGRAYGDAIAAAISGDRVSGGEANLCD